MRLFVAVDLPTELRQQLAELVQDIRKQGLFGGSFVAPENFHLTLNFIGEIPEARLADLKATLKKSLAGFKPFRLELAGLGAFPSKTSPRILFVAARELDEARWHMTKIHNSIREGLHETGLKAAHYESHVTLARVNAFSKSRVRIKEFFEKCAETRFGEFQVSEVVLMKSTLAREGPIYEILERFEFG